MVTIRVNMHVRCATFIALVLVVKACAPATRSIAVGCYMSEEMGFEMVGSTRGLGGHIRAGGDVAGVASATATSGCGNIATSRPCLSPAFLSTTSIFSRRCIFDLEMSGHWPCARK